MESNRQDNSVSCDERQRYAPISVAHMEKVTRSSDQLQFECSIISFICARIWFICSFIFGSP